MPSGSEWSKNWNFKLVNHDYSKIEGHIGSLKINSK